MRRAARQETLAKERGVTFSYIEAHDRQFARIEQLEAEYARLMGLIADLDI